MKKRLLLLLLVLLCMDLWSMVEHTNILQQSEFNELHKKIVRWAEKPLSKELLVAVKDIFIFLTKHDLLTVAFGKLSAHEEKMIENYLKKTNQLLSDIFKDLPFQQEAKNFITQSFLNYIMTAQYHEHKNILNALTCNGKLLAKIYDYMITQENNPPFIPITIEVALRGSFFGSEYKKEYFFTDKKLQKIDNEKKDGNRYWFYAKKIKTLEIGPTVVDKR